MPTPRFSFARSPFPKGRDYVGARCTGRLRQSVPTGRHVPNADILGMDIWQYLYLLNDENRKRENEAVVRSTAELFPDAQISLTQEADPEGGDDEYSAVSVTTRGEINDLAARHREWHCRLRLIAPQTATSYRLVIDVQ